MKSAMKCGFKCCAYPPMLYRAASVLLYPAFRDISEAEYHGIGW